MRSSFLARVKIQKVLINFLSQNTFVSELSIEFLKNTITIKF